MQVLSKELNHPKRKYKFEHSKPQKVMVEVAPQPFKDIKRSSIKATKLLKKKKKFNLAKKSKDVDHHKTL